MPIPTSINDLSLTAASNSPAGSETITLADDYLRVYASYIAALRNVVLSASADLNTQNAAYSGTLTGLTGIVNIGAGQFYKDAGGNVGFGTTAPVKKLTIQTAPAAGPVIGLNINNPYGYGSGVGVAGAGIRFTHSPNDAGTTGVIADIYGISEGETGSTQGALVFATRNGASEVTTEHMRIKSAGQINLTPVSGLPTGAAGDIAYDLSTSKHYGHNGTVWLALY
jgi:hypothetical protein